MTGKMSEKYEPATLQEQKEASETALTTLRAAVQWHLSGADWSSIATRFDFSSPQAARIAVEKFEGDMVDSTDLEAARSKALARYERLLMSEWGDATTPFILDEDGKPTKSRNEAHGAAFDRARGIVGDIVRLKGAAAPVQLALYTPGQDEIFNVVNELRAATLRGIAKEADLIEIEAEEDLDAEE